MISSTLRFLNTVVVIAAIGMFLSSVTGCSKSKPKSGDKSESEKTTDTGKSGASGNGSNGSSNSAKKPCDFVTLAEVNKVTGANYTQVMSQGNPVAAAVCTYSDEKGKSMIVGIIRRNGAAKITSNKNFTGYQMIKDLGDEAIWVPVPGYLAVRKGADAIAVTITGRKDTADMRFQHAKAIAKIGLDRM